MKALIIPKNIKTIFIISLSILIGIIISSLFIYSNFDNKDIVYANTEYDNNLNNALSLQNIYRKVSVDVLPIVVEVEAVEIRTDNKPAFSNPFNFLFGPENDNLENGNELKKFRNSGLGSGIIVRKGSDNYYVLTNNHVAGNADEITIRLFDNRSYIGELVGKDERKDLALISFKTDEILEVANLGDSDDLYVGDFVLAVGNPFGFQSTVTSGIISALGRRQGPDDNISDFIQTDASINHLHIDHQNHQDLQLQVSHQF